MEYTQDTIFAPSSAIGGAIAVIRISGPKAGDAEKLLGRNLTDRPGRLLFTRIHSSAEVIDDVIVKRTFRLSVENFVFTFNLDGDIAL